MWWSLVSHFSTNIKHLSCAFASAFSQVSLAFHFYFPFHRNNTNHLRIILLFQHIFSVVFLGLQIYPYTFIHPLMFKFELLQSIFLFYFKTYFYFYNFINFFICTRIKITKILTCVSIIKNHKHSKKQYMKSHH